MPSDVAENTPGASANVVREVRTKRRHVRVQMPLSVTLAGHTYSVADWSLGGFGIEGIKTSFNKGDRVKPALSFMFHGYAFTIVIPCEVVFVGKDKSEVGCRFENITPDQNELIRYLINAHLSGRIATVDGILTAASNRNAALPVTTTPPPPLTLKEKVAVQVRRGSRYAMYGFLGFILVTLIYLSVYARFFTVSSEFAAVTAQIVRMRAAEDGWVEMNRLILGARVFEGDLLFRLQQPDLETDIAIARSGLDREQAQLDAYRTEAENLGDFFESYKDLSSSELDQARIEFRVAENQFERVQSLFEEGFVSERSLDDARANLAEAQAKLSTALINTDLVDKGFYYSGSRLEGEDPERLANLIFVTEKSVALAQSTLNGLMQKQERLTQTSPCDCVIQDVRASNGEFVQKGSMVLVLEDQSEERVTVEAKVPHTSLSSLEIDGTAEVLFSDDQGVVKGEILDVSHFRQSEIYSGLPDFVSDDPNLGTVLISVNREDGVKTLGLPVQVRFPITIKNKVFGAFGVDASL